MLLHYSEWVLFYVYHNPEIENNDPQTHTPTGPAFLLAYLGRSRRGLTSKIMLSTPHALGPSLCAGFHGFSQTPKTEESARSQYLCEEENMFIRAGMKNRAACISIPPRVLLYLYHTPGIQNDDSQPHAPATFGISRDKSRRTSKVHQERKKGII